MVLTLGQPANNYYSNHAFNPLDINRHRSSVDSVFSFFFVTYRKLCGKGSFVSLKFAMHKPTAYAKPKHSVSLPSDPMLVIWGDAGARHTLKDNLPAIREADGD